MKAGEPTRYSDTSTGDGTGCVDVHPTRVGPSMPTMKKLLMLAVLGTLVAVAVKKVRSI